MSPERFQSVIRKPRVPKAVWTIGLTLIVAAAALYWFQIRVRPGEAPQPPVTVTSAPAHPAPPPDVPLPSGQDSDTQLRAELAEVSPMSEFKTWLAADGLLVRWVTVTDQIARDTSPRAQVPFLVPDKPFEAAPEGDAYVLSSRGHVRYDLFAKVARSIDAQKFAAVYRVLHPFLQTAYHQLGYPSRSIDDATKDALQRLSDAPVRERPPQLAKSGSLYVFTDAALESLGPVEKALLRMGPENTRLIQQEARELAPALGFTLRMEHVERDDAMQH